ncbi:ATP-binding protein [Arhodomonas sp. SL1]|uniref:ATP-binding protein n=1 Tax=Arhodomonas sp. SL1 TaxID=3425691 RepID=UPI003F88576D
MTASLHRRLLVTAAAVTLTFGIVTALGLEAAFRESALAAQRDRLRASVHTLLAGAEIEPDDIRLRGEIAAPRLTQPGSGLYAWVVTPDNEIAWRSPSAVGRTLSPPTSHAPGTIELSRGDGHFRMDYGVEWEPVTGPTRRFTITVMESEKAFLSQIRAFRQTLGAWLGLGAAGLLGALWLALRWGLTPLRRVAAEVEAMQAGRAASIGGHYPREIAQLTERINALARAERERSRRYRETLDNLAHSLKTPLAVLRGALSRRTAEDLDAAGEQLARIDRQIEYHVRRSGAGQLAGGGHTVVEPVVRRLLRALRHAHPDRPRRAELDCPPGLWYAGSEDDLMELLGNLLDNAWRHARGEVRISGGRCTDCQWRTPMIVLCIDDDGPGIPEAVREGVLARGARLDQRDPGEGIGLAVVGELVAQVDGGVTIDTAPGLGGTRVTLTLPGGSD